MSEWKKCRKRPIIVKFREVKGECEEVVTREGTMFAYPDRDVIIRGVQGEIYPCKRDIFDMTYDIVADLIAEAFQK